VNCATSSSVVHPDLFSVITSHKMFVSPLNLFVCHLIEAAYEKTKVTC